MHARIRTNKLLRMLCVAAILNLLAGGAIAGEITGNGKSLKTGPHTLHGKSACAFSGLNDTYSGDPSVPDEDGFFRTQSWGQIPKMIRDIIRAFGFHPGDSCNPTKPPLEL